MAFFIARLLLIHEDERRLGQREFKLYRRILRDSNNPFELDDFNFKKLFRLPKDTIQMLIEILRDTLQRKRSSGLAVEVQVHKTYLKIINAIIFF